MSIYKLHELSDIKLLYSTPNAANAIPQKHQYKLAGWYKSKSIQILYLSNSTDTTLWKYLLVKAKIKHTYTFSSLPVVLFIHIDSFGVSRLVLEISAVEISAFSLM